MNMLRSAKPETSLTKSPLLEYKSHNVI